MHTTLPAEVIAIRKLPNSIKTIHSTVDCGLFPSALRLDLNSYDAEQVREQAAFWSYEHKQFGRGGFLGKIVAVYTKRLRTVNKKVPNGSTLPEKQKITSETI